MILTATGPHGVGLTPEQRIDVLFGKLPCFKQSGEACVACCPAHDDSNASLSISVGDGERILLRCFAGCSTDVVLKKMGLSMADLFQPEDDSGETFTTIEAAEAEADRILARQHSTRVGRWDYFTAGGELIGRTLRYDTPTKRGLRQNKTFRPLSLQPDGRWAIRAMQAPRPLYRLAHLLASKHIVFFAEGEKAAQALADIGLNATTFAGGADSVGKTDYSPLAGRGVVLLPDNDAAGEKCMNKLAELLMRLDPPAVVGMLRLPGLPDKGDVVEYIAARRSAGDTDATLRAGLEALAAKGPPPATVAATAANPLLPLEPSWPAPPEQEAYHGLAGRIVRAIEPASEADPAALLIQTMVAFGNAIGKTAYFTVEADQHFANEFANLIGKTSKARKGTSAGQVRRQMREVEPQWERECIQGGVSSGEGVIWAIRDEIKKFVDGEEKVVDPGVADKRLLLFEPEFANVLKQPERQGNTLSIVLREAWDGHDLRSMTKNSPARSTGAHVSIIGHITIEELRRYLTVTEMANGFGNRFLWLCVQRSKLLPEGGSVDSALSAKLGAELARAVAFAKSVGLVTRDDEARALWHEVYGPLSEGKPGLAGALLARSEAHVMRLAMIYALMDCSPKIEAAHLLAALALWDYCERSIYFIFGDCLGDPVADDLLRLLRANSDGLTRTDMNNYFGRNLSSDRIGRALGLLLQHQLVRREQQKTEGRPAERWFAATRATAT